MSDTKRSTYICPSGERSGISSEVYVNRAIWLFLTRCCWTPSIANSYIYRRYVYENCG